MPTPSGGDLRRRPHSGRPCLLHIDACHSAESRRVLCVGMEASFLTGPQRGTSSRDGTRRVLSP